MSIPLRQRNSPWLAVVVLAATVLISCQRETSDDISGDFLGIATEAEERGDFGLAYYGLLAAVRLEPGSPEVFDAVLDAGKRFLASDDPDAFDLAYELIAHAERMIPRQSTSRLMEAYQRHNQVLNEAGRFIPEPTFPDDGFEEQPVSLFYQHLGLAEDRGIPVAIRLSLLDGARGLVAREALSNTVSERVDGDARPHELLQSMIAEIDEIEAGIIKGLYEEHLEKVGDWTRRIHAFGGSLNDDVDSLSAAKRITANSEKTLRLIQEGETLRRRHVEFVDVDQGEVNIDSTIAHLRWIYSARVVLPWIGFVDEFDLTSANRVEALSKVLLILGLGPCGTPSAFPLATWTEISGFIDGERDRVSREAEAMLKLGLLSSVRANLTMPYVWERFEETWQQHYEELNSDGRIRASTLRLWMDSR